MRVEGHNLIAQKNVLQIIVTKIVIFILYVLPKDIMICNGYSEGESCILHTHRRCRTLMTRPNVNNAVISHAP